MTEKLLLTLQLQTCPTSSVSDIWHTLANSLPDMISVTDLSFLTGWDATGHSPRPSHST